MESNNNRLSRIFFVLPIIISFLIGTQISYLQRVFPSSASSYYYSSVFLWDTTTSSSSTDEPPKKSSSSSTTTLEQQQSLSDFNLAYDESYGYFTTISNDEWILRKTYASTANQYHRYVTSPKRFWEKPSIWHYNNYNPIFSCPYNIRVGGIGDGPKYTCDPHRLKDVVTQRKKDREKQQQQQRSSSSTTTSLTTTTESHPEFDCLIYSIGSNGNYQWEDGMYEINGGGICEIHVFDYSQNYTRKKNLGRNIHFHQIGLQGSQRPSRSKFMSFPQIVQHFNHTNRIIDIFKIDCEGCEWSTYLDWISYPHIRQVLIETHNLPSNKTMGLHFFDSFQQNNLYMYSKEVNPWGGGSCVEYSYIKLSETFSDATVL